MVNSAYRQLLSRFTTESEKSLRRIAKDARLNHGTLVRQCQGVQPQRRITVVRIAYSLALSPTKARRLIHAARPAWELTQQEEDDLEGISRETNPIVRESLMKVAIDHLVALTGVVTTLDNRVKVVQSEAGRARQAMERLEQDVRVVHGIAQGLQGLDSFLDSPFERYWPKRSDVSSGTMCWPEQQISRVHKVIQKEGRILLSGSSGSGKTALAVAYALRRRESDPASTPYYLDLQAGGDFAVGEEWYRRIAELKDQPAVVIVDNCHLAREVANALCARTREKRPLAEVVFVSAPRSGDSPWDDSPEDYFKCFDQNNEIVVAATETYRTILMAFSKRLCQTTSAQHVPVETDLRDPERARIVERLCAHNLIATRAIIAAWSEAGGSLSDVSSDAALDLLGVRYLTGRKANTLARLCALGQFEIAAHTSHVETLRQEDVAALCATNLLTAEDSARYGRCFRLTLHPQTASLVWRASLKRRYGAGFQRQADDDTMAELHSYVRSNVRNFFDAYRHVHMLGEPWMARALGASVAFSLRAK